MNMCVFRRGNKNLTFFASERCHPQTIAVLRTRAAPRGIQLIVGDEHEHDFEAQPVAGALLQYPGTDGQLADAEQLRSLVSALKASKCVTVCSTDLLALCLLVPPGELGFDVAVGSSQRFGQPLGYGGPHAAFLATTHQLERVIPGRIIGVSKDMRGLPAYRMAMQTREQHIRRERATSNICTSQALLANCAAFYAVYHGAEGLRSLAQRIHRLAVLFADGCSQMNLEAAPRGSFFDTVRVRLADVATADAVMAAALVREMNLRRLDRRTITVSLDEVTKPADVQQLLDAFARGTGVRAERVPRVSALDAAAPELQHGGDALLPGMQRQSTYLQHPTFRSYHSETELMRYIHLLASRDLGLQTAMIPLGSCTMKLNAAAEMRALSWGEFANIHPFVPRNQARGYDTMVQRLEHDLCVLTGMDTCTLQPNAGSQGEYAGLLAIRAYLASKGDTARDVCLIPVSAHGTNPASCVMAGMRVVTVRCDARGNIDMDDLESKAEKHRDDLAAFMVTYPSTHGVFEAGIKKMCEIVHEAGGQVYLDGANMNAQIALTSPGDIGADVCHLNLHKTFCIPHGGGGPGVGPICVRSHLAPFLPTHTEVPEVGGQDSSAVVSAAPFGSPLILPITYAYIRMMGADGLKRATRAAILNANYMAQRLRNHFSLLYTGEQGRVAHEFIIDLRPFKKVAEAADVARRLMDYGFHAPTMSFPVANTLMIEPTESESKAEMDRLCDALISIRQELADIERGIYDPKDNVVKNSPHTADMVISDTWDRPYSRELAAYPTDWTRTHKFWPFVGRIDGAYGDRNLFCTCPPVDLFTLSPGEDSGELQTVSKAPGGM
jgi:glycine cleavage system P protein (glycine dehydrogenase)